MAADGFAHCGDSMCQGNGPQPVRVVRTLLEWTIGSRGGDGIFANIVETSTEDVRLAGPADEHLYAPPGVWEDEGFAESMCEYCGKGREISVADRPTYAPMSGFPQNGLLHIHGFDPNIRNSEADQAAAAAVAAQALEMQALRDQMAEQSAQMAALLDQLGEPTTAEAGAAA